MQEGIRALTKAMLTHAERPVSLALQNASFAKTADPGHHAAQALRADPINPDGNYRFDLAHPAQRQVAIDLLKCAPPTQGMERIREWLTHHCSTPHACVPPHTRPHVVAPSVQHRRRADELRAAV